MFSYFELFLKNFHFIPMFKVNSKFTEDDIMEEGDEPGSPPSPFSVVDQDAPLSALNQLEQPQLSQTMVIDTDSEMQSPVSPDTGVDRGTDVIDGVNNHLEEVLGDEGFEEADDVLGVDFQEGTLVILDYFNYYH